MFNRNIEGHDKTDYRYVSDKRSLWRHEVSFGRLDAGVRAHMVRMWNGSENYLYVDRRNPFIGATVNCKYHVQS
jgi:hypothetical protein